jgi:hypothetical protein
MKIKVTAQLLVLLLATTFAPSAAEHIHTSPYAGEQKREIKSLSETDIEKLQNGKGWGLSKAAELNGVSGPLPFLEMKKEIDLSAEQVQAIEDIFREIKKRPFP